MQVRSVPNSLLPGFDGLGFTKYVNVFGVNVLGTKAVPASSILHAAKILAEYLDNDRDFEPDDPDVKDVLYKKHASLLIFADDEEAEGSFPPPWYNLKGWMNLLNLWISGSLESLQDLYHSEIHPDSKSLDAFKHEEGSDDRFDASIEETLHLITHVGVARVYPEEFGEGVYAHAAGTGGAMSTMNFLIDDLNGNCGFGYYKDYVNPSSDECVGFYAYDDPTCDYQCIQAEGLYWSLTSLLGAQNYTERMEEIDNEVRLRQRSELHGS